jgi:hypothetical protein
MTATTRLDEMEARLAELKADLADVEAEQNARPNLYSLPDSQWKAELQARKPLGHKHHELVKAISAKEKDIQNLIWVPAVMTPVPFLVTLRDAIVNGPEPPKRTPKWRFRPADDFAVLIQARDKARVLFECVALEGARINAESFSEKRADHRQLRQLKFDIRPDGELWMLKPTSGRYSSDDNVSRYSNDGYEARHAREMDAHRRLIAFKDRIIEALGSMFKDDEIPLLSEHCLICGKGLTDAVSKSRLIGPECANNYTRDGARIVTPLYVQRADDSVNGEGRAA